VAGLEKNIVLMVKTLKEVQSNHPIGYVSFITPSLELVYSYVFSPSAAGDQHAPLYCWLQEYGLVRMGMQSKYPESWPAPHYPGQLFERFVVCALNLFQQILRCEDYNPPQNLHLSESSPPPQVMEAHQAKLRFFKASTCQELLERLVGHFMGLSEEELSNWEDDPEDFGESACPWMDGSNHPFP